MKVHISDVRNGDTISQDTFNDYGLHVLSKGTILNEADISRLVQHRIDFIDIHDRPAITVHTEVSENAAPFTHTASSQEALPRWLPKMQPIYEETIDSFRNMFKEALASDQVDEKVVDTVLAPLISNLEIERDVVSMMLLLNSTGEYTYHHSLQVGMLSYYLAAWLGYSKEETVRIGKAGFLHDIGKCRIAAEILNKPSKLTNEEFDQVKKHTEYGWEILKNSTDDELSAIAALQHHERVDGSGYPHALKGNEIHPISKIVAVADIYSAMISQRVYQEKRDMLAVLKELERLSFFSLDAYTTQTFIRNMIPNFIGKRAQLTTGEEGTIILTNPNDFFRPLVNVNGKFIDLNEERHCEIAHIYL